MTLIPTERKRQPDEAINEWLLREIESFNKRYLKRLEDIKTGEIKQEDFKYDLKPVVVHTFWYWAITIAIGIFLVAITGGLILGTANLSVANIAVWPLLLVPILIYIYLSIREVKVNEIAGAYFWGAPMMEFGNGPKLVWRGAFELSKEPANMSQAEFPGDQDKVFRGDEKDILPEGMVRPIRVLFAEDPNGDLPTDKQMAADVSGFVIARVVSENFFEFQKRVNPIDETQRSEVLKTMRVNQESSPRMLEVMRYLVDIYARVMREIAGQMSYNQTNIHMGLVNELLLIRLQYALIGMGVKISSVGTTAINSGHDFNKTIQERGEAKAKRDARITLAEATQTELEKAGKGDAKALQLKIYAQTRGLVNQAKELGIDGASALNAQIGLTLAEKEGIVVLGQTGLDQLVGLGLAKAGEKKPAAKTTPKKPEEGDTK